MGWNGVPDRRYSCERMRVSLREFDSQSAAINVPAHYLRDTAIAQIVISMAATVMNAEQSRLTDKMLGDCGNTVLLQTLDSHSGHTSSEERIRAKVFPVSTAVGCLLARGKAGNLSGMEDEAIGRSWQLTYPRGPALRFEFRKSARRWRSKRLSILTRHSKRYGPGIAVLQ